MWEPVLLLQRFFFATDDIQLITRMAHLLIIFGILNIVYNYAMSSPSPYGRYDSLQIKWLTLPNLSPMVGWMIQEAPAFIIPAWLMLFGSCKSSLVNKLLIGMFMLHYFHRSFIYPFYLPSKKRNMFIVFLAAFVFCTYNGFLQGYGLLCQEWYPVSHLSTASFVLGAILYFFGLGINTHSDYILINLRKPGETDYKIPKGGMFEYVSCANYFGEIVEWWGYALATLNYPSFAFAFFATLFLGQRAVFHHRFYLKKMKNYPKHRKAVIPFIL